MCMYWLNPMDSELNYWCNLQNSGFKLQEFYNLIFMQNFEK
jgi:hypothetical protein